MLLFNKPYGVVCQFSPCGDRRTLKDFIPVPDVYAAGRLDADSEGLVVLTDSGVLQHRISHPRAKLPKTYWAQVEGEPARGRCLARLESGVELGDLRHPPRRVRVIAEPPGLWERDPPIRFRKTVPTAWLEIVLVEGREPSGATDDRGGRTANAAPYSLLHRSLDPLEPRAGRMARSRDRR